MGNIMGQRWHDILGGRYSVSDQGRIYSYRTGTFRKVFIKDNGYLSVGLWDGTTAKNYYVHRLVAEAFVPNPTGQPEVNHKNLCKWDNYYKNLEWVTHQENTRHAGAAGRMFRGAGEAKDNSKLTEADVREIRRRYVRWSGGKLAREFGVSGTTIRLIVRRLAWKHV